MNKILLRQDVMDSWRNLGARLDARLSLFHVIGLFRCSLASSSTRLKARGWIYHRNNCNLHCVGWYAYQSRCPVDL